MSCRKDRIISISFLTIFSVWHCRILKLNPGTFQMKKRRKAFLKFVITVLAIGTIAVIGYLILVFESRMGWNDPAHSPSRRIGYYRFLFSVWKTEDRTMI